MKSPTFDGSPQPPSRLAVLTWFTFQWLCVPLELVIRLVWNLAMFFGDGVDGAGMKEPLARFMSPAKLALSMSRNPRRWERHVDRLFGHLADQLRGEKFTWGTLIRHPQMYVSRESAGVKSRVRALTVDFREFRGANYPVVQASLARHGLKAKPCVTGDPSQGLWVYLTDDLGIPVSESSAA
ncbi:hypothetical protein EJ357_33610 [Streptomyces cyaneochromogenes]|uniref:Uncharacterized protein n=1 Tax=Streptomyces cyaneochromogenes TaxID=2496836 RepID=A0A3Q9ERT0_9ACTN|nr:hypothetical protein [Streptomyces cyaneochromogenes]AZQ37791.1 hypothetical protein EJ357_33610 [Streptomyces cyaneochromogenes]